MVCEGEKESHVICASGRKREESHSTRFCYLICNILSLLRSEDVINERIMQTRDF